MHTPLDIRLVFHCSPIGCQLLLSPVSIVTLLCPVFLLYYAPCLECITPQVPIVSPFYAQQYTVFLFFKGSSHKKMLSPKPDILDSIGVSGLARFGRRGLKIT